MVPTTYEGNQETPLILGPCWKTQALWHSTTTMATKKTVGISPGNQKRKGELWADPGLRGFAKRRSMAEHVASWKKGGGRFKKEHLSCLHKITSYIYIYLYICNHFGVVILFRLKEYRTPYAWAREKEHFAGTKKTHKARIKTKKDTYLWTPETHGKMKILGPNIIWVITNPTKKMKES